MGIGAAQIFIGVGPGGSIGIEIYRDSGLGFYGDYFSYLGGDYLPYLGGENLSIFSYYSSFLVGVPTRVAVKGFATILIGFITSPEIA